MIVEYLDGVSNVGLLIPVDFETRISTKRLEALADGVIDASLCIFAERLKRPTDLQYSAWVERQMGKIHRGLTLLSKELEGRAVFIGESFGLADLSVVSALGYIGLRFSEDFNWEREYPALSVYYQHMLLRPSVAKTIPVL